MKPQGGWKRTCINAFIIFHLLALGLWGMPGSRFRATLVRFYEKYIITCGLWHSWDMFAPDPLSLNFHVESEITFRDGTRKVWDFPRMERLGLWEKYQMERYRKWRERVRLDAYQMVWDDTCRWIARSHDNSTNPPVSVALTRHWGPIPPPVKGDFQPIPETYTLPFNYRFRTYTVKPEDLQ